MKKYNKEITSIKESDEVLKSRELEQTQELLVGLTKELFNKIEKLEQKEKFENKETDIPKEKYEENQKDASQEVSKIEFTDLSWYRNKLDNSQKS